MTYWKCCEGSDSSDDDEDGSGDEGDASGDDEVPERMSMPPAAAPAAQATQDPIWDAESQDVDMVADESAAQPSVEVKKRR